MSLVTVNASGEEISVKANIILLLTVKPQGGMR